MKRKCRKKPLCNTEYKIGRPGNTDIRELVEMVVVIWLCVCDKELVFAFIFFECGKEEH